MKRPVIVERIPSLFAPLYEKATKMAGQSYYKQVAKEVATKLKAGNILDLGTGPGYLPIHIADRSASITVDGIDLSRRLVHTAKRNAARAGVSGRVHFEVGNAAGLPCPDEKYDMVISTGMLHMVKDPVKVLKEIHRVLKPGGEAWIYDPARISSQINRKEWMESLSLWEWFTYQLFRVFTRINPPREYHRKHVIAMINETNFRGYEIEEEEHEMKIRLMK